MISNPNSNSSIAHEPTPDGCHPTPLIPSVRKAALIKDFLDLHDLKVNSWDTREDPRGHVVLKWAEPGLALGVIAVISEDHYTVDIARDSVICNRWKRRQQSVSVKNDYQVPSHDFRAAISAIQSHRGKKISA